MRILLIIVGVFVLMIVTAVSIGYVMFKRHGPQLKSRIEKSVAEGEAFGKGRPDSECVDEAFAHLKRCTGFVCEADAQLFLTSCLAEAEPTAALCIGVPKPDSLRETIRWSLEECEKRGMPRNQRCTRLIGAIQSHCSRPVSREDDSSALR